MKSSKFKAAIGWWEVSLTTARQQALDKQQSLNLSKSVVRSWPEPFVALPYPLAVAPALTAAPLTRHSTCTATSRTPLSPWALTELQYVSMSACWKHFERLTSTRYSDRNSMDHMSFTWFNGITCSLPDCGLLLPALVRWLSKPPKTLVLQNPSKLVSQDPTS